MTRQELIAIVSGSTNTSQAQVDNTFTAIFSAIEDLLKTGQSLIVPGFGTFSVKDRAARTGRNPRTGESLEIAAAKAAHFKQSKVLKEALNA